MKISVYLNNLMYKIAMEKVILFLGISFSLHAEIDSLKTTYTEEKVEKFEKTTLIDEYDIAFGGNKGLNNI